MGDLLGHFRGRSRRRSWEMRNGSAVLDLRRHASHHDGAPSPSASSCRCTNASRRADFGVSLAERHPGRPRFFRERALADKTDETAGAITRLFKQLDAEDSPLRDIVGPQADAVSTTSARREAANVRCRDCSLRPGERPIMGGCAQADDVATVVDALVSCLGWDSNAATRENVKRAYLRSRRTRA